MESLVLVKNYSRKSPAKHLKEVQRQKPRQSTRTGQGAVCAGRPSIRRDRSPQGNLLGDAMYLPASDADVLAPDSHDFMLREKVAEDLQSHIIIRLTESRGDYPPPSR